MQVKVSGKVKTQIKVIEAERVKKKGFGVAWYGVGNLEEGSLVRVAVW